MTPHLAEADEPTARDPAPLPALAEDATASEPLPRGSRARGLVLHELMEEVLTGEVADTEVALAARAGELAAQLAGMPDADELDAKEAARAVQRGLAIPEIACIRDRLIPECPVAHSVRDEAGEVVTIGVADAIAWDGERIELVVDWKSDVAPSAATIGQYRAQVAAYLSSTAAPSGCIVFLTSGRVEHVGRP